MQLLHRPSGRLLDGVGHRHDAQGFPVGSHEHHRLALVLQPLRLGEKAVQADAALRHQLAVAQKDSATVRPTLHAMPGDSVEAIGILDLQPAAPGAPHDRLAQRVLGVLLDHRRQPQHVLLQAT